MASGESLRLRYITRKPGKVIHPMPASTRRFRKRRMFAPTNEPYRNPDRAARKATQLATRRAARARRQAQGD